MPSYYGPRLGLTPPPPKKKRTVGGFFGNVLGDVPQLARSLVIDLPAQLGKGAGYTAADLWRNDVGSAGRRLGRAGAAIGLGLTRSVDQLTPSVGILKDLEEWHLVGRNEKGEWDYLFRKVDPDDVEDFKRAIYEDPVISTLSVLPAAGTASRLGSVGRIASSIKKANPDMKGSEAWRLASHESRKPGYAALQGTQGGIPERTLEIDLGGEGFRSVPLAQSTSPIGRGIESLYDRLSRASMTPAVLSEPARAGRMERRSAREQTRLQQAAAQGMFQPILEEAYGFTGPVEYLRYGRKAPGPKATALTALLQLPKELPAREALETWLRSRNQVLSDKGKMIPEYPPLTMIGENWIGKPVAHGDPEGDIYTLKSMDKEGAVLAAPGKQTITVSPDDVFPLKRKGKEYVAPREQLQRLDDVSLQLIDSEAKELRAALAQGIDTPEFNRALRSLEDISRLVETLGMQLQLRGLKGKELATRRAQVQQRYDRRKQLVINDLVAKGLLPEGTDLTARAYFPHLSVWRNLAQNWSGSVRLPASSLVIGRPRPRGDVTRMQRSKGVLHETGQASLDPAALMSLLSARMRALETYSDRADYYAIALPLSKAPKGRAQTQGYFIRDPDMAAKSISDRTRAEMSLSDEEWRALVQRGEDTFTKLDDPDVLNSEPTDWLAPLDIGRPEWAGEKGVRWLPAEVVEARFGRRVFRGEAGTALGIANALARISLIVGRPFRYAASNLPSNVAMLAASNPGALPEVARFYSGKLGRDLLKAERNGEIPSAPELLNRIRSQSGEVKATAGIPKFSERRVTKLEEAEEGLARHTSRLADWEGNWLDDPFRVAAWLSKARSYGFRSPAELQRLLTDEQLSGLRQQIRQRTRDDLLDFDSLTDLERQKISRLLFVYPFMRASTKYPFIYAKEKPVAAGLLSTFAEQAPSAGLPFAEDLLTGQAASEVQVPEGVPLIGGDRIDLSQLSPVAPLAEVTGSAQALSQGQLAPLGDYLTPGLRLGSELPGMEAKDLPRELLGFTPYVGPFARNAIDSGFMDAAAEELLRYTPRRPFRSVRESKAEEVDALIRHYGEDMILDPAYQKSLNAYWQFQDLRARAKLGVKERHGRDTLTPIEERALLTVVWERWFPDWQMPQLVVSEESNEAYQDAMFAVRDYLNDGLP